MFFASGNCFGEVRPVRSLGTQYLLQEFWLEVQVCVQGQCPAELWASCLDGEDVLIQPGGREAENQVIETPSSCAVSSPSASAEQLSSPSILEQKLVFWETFCFPVTEGNYFSHLRET